MTTDVSKAQKKIRLFVCAFTRIDMRVIEDESDFVIGTASSAIAAGIGRRNRCNQMRFVVFVASNNAGGLMQLEMKESVFFLKKKYQNN